MNLNFYQAVHLTHSLPHSFSLSEIISLSLLIHKSILKKNNGIIGLFVWLFLSLFFQKFIGKIKSKYSFLYIFLWLF